MLYSKGFSYTYELIETFAASLMKNDPSLSFSSAMEKAWKEIEENGIDAYRLIEFTKTNDEQVKRVILNKSWHEVYKVKGTGKKLSIDRKLFVDAAKYKLGLHASLTVYIDRVLQVA